MSPSGTPVLFCYDGSERAEYAIRRAAELLTRSDALVVTVWQPTAALEPSLGYTSAMHDFVELDRAGADEAERVAEEGAQVARDAGVEATPLAVKAIGPLWHTILETATEHHAETIVTGSRGLTGLRGVLLGSVSGGVAHHATRPVLVIHSPD